MTVVHRRFVGLVRRLASGTSQCRSAKVTSQNRPDQMTSQDRPDHLQRTGDCSREEVLRSAVITHVEQLSPTVKGLTLQVQDQGIFSFKAGQWVDFHITGVATVGGYSLCSSPATAVRRHSFNLAVKSSDHPPSHWVHSQCKVGDKVKVRVGGDFCYDPKSEDEPHHLLLVAGGVGINPLLSILRHVRDVEHNATSRNVTDAKITSCNANMTTNDVRHATASNEVLRNVHLLYSASSVQELIFKDDILELCGQGDDLKATFYITREKQPGSQYRVGRIDNEAVREALSWLKQSRDGHVYPVRVYVCGPAPMIDSVESDLRTLGIQQQHIHYEKWW